MAYLESLKRDSMEKSMLGEFKFAKAKALTMFSLC